MLPGGIVVHHHKVPVPGVSRKIIYQFSDTHLALSDSDSTGQETKTAEERSAAWLGIREGFARQYD